MEVGVLKQQARALEQQGRTEEAIATYRLVWSVVEGTPAAAPELPVLIKIGDLLLKGGNSGGAIEMYEKAGNEYASLGTAPSVIALCVKIVRCDPGHVGVYLRLARQLLERGHVVAAREVLTDYARRAKLEKTREGLERLAGRPDEEVKRVLEKAIASAEQRVPPRPDRSAGSAEPAPPGAAEEPPDTSPPPEPPRKRLTVPVGAIEADPTPELQHHPPPEPTQEPPSGHILEPVAQPQPPPMPPLPEPAPFESTLAPTPIGPPPRPVAPPPPPPRVEAPSPPPPPPPRPRASRPSGPVLTPGPKPSRRRTRSPWVWPASGAAAIVVIGTALVAMGIIPLGKGPEPAPPRGVLTRPDTNRASPAPDTVMARDTATGTAQTTPSPTVPPPVTVPTVAPPRLPPPAAALPAGVALSRPALVVGGLRIESVEEIADGDRQGYAIVQITGAGQRIILREFPSDSAGATGEIGVSGLTADTVIGTTHFHGFDVTLRGVVNEGMVVQLLQQLVEVRPQE